MSDDTSTDVTNTEDDNVADVPLFSDIPVAEATTEESSQTEDETPAEGTETEITTDKAETTEAKDTEATGEETTQTDQATQEKGRPDPELARQAYLERQQTRRAAEQAIDQNYRPKTEDDLLEEGLDPVDAKIQAIREDMEYREQRAFIAEQTANVRSDVIGVLNDFPVFNPDSKDYDPDFTKEVEEAYQTAARLQTTDDGLILNAEVPLYEFHKRMAGIYSRGQSRGQQQEASEVIQTMARTEAAVGSSSSSSKSSETLDEMGERLANVPLF